MASKRRLSTTPSPEKATTSTTTTQLDNSPKPSLCLICGDKARIINYGTLSCQSCKTFFRRNGFRPESVRPCIFNQTCAVNMQTRHNCTACRLAKCFAMGMSSDLIRKEDYKKVKSSTSTKSENNGQITTAPQLAAVDLDGEEQYFLIDSEWTKLSNILQAYETYSTVSQMCKTIDNLSTLPFETHLNPIKPFEIVGQMFTSIQSFISSSPDFQILTINEQTSLSQRNLYSIVGFYSALFFRNTGIFHNIQYMEAFTTIYGSEMMSLAKNVNSRLDPDSTLIKLILFIFAFSSNGFILSTRKNMEHDSLLYGTYRLLGSQNVYVELLWKYMVYRYGHNESVLRFARLIQIYMCVVKHLAIINENNEVHQNMVDDIIEKIKKSLTMNGNKPNPLWGKP